MMKILIGENSLKILVIHDTSIAYFLLIEIVCMFNGDLRHEISI